MHGFETLTWSAVPFLMVTRLPCRTYGTAPQRTARTSLAILHCKSRGPAFILLATYEYEVRQRMSASILPYWSGYYKISKKTFVDSTLYCVMLKNSEDYLCASVLYVSTRVPYRALCQCLEREYLRTSAFLQTSANQSRTGTYFVPPYSLA